MIHSQALRVYFFSLILALMCQKARSLQVNCTQHVTLTIGRDAIISCSIQTDHPIRRYSWRKNDILILSRERGVISGDVHFIPYNIFPNGSLLIRKASNEIEGKYEFRVITEVTLESASDNIFIDVIELTTQKPQPTSKSSALTSTQEKRHSFAWVAIFIAIFILIVMIIFALVLYRRKQKYERQSDETIPIDERAHKRIEKLKFFEDPKNCKCNGDWSNSAKKVLHRNGISTNFFFRAVYRTLAGRRGNEKNLVLIGKDNCGKTFLLLPLREVFTCFPHNQKNTHLSTHSDSDDSHLLDQNLDFWKGADKADVIFLDDFELEESGMKPKAWLHLLKGRPTKENALGLRGENAESKEIDILSKPIFCTAKELMLQNENDHDHDDQSEETWVNMMKDCLKQFNFHKEVKVSEDKGSSSQKVIPDCPHCFSKLVLQHQHNRTNINVNTV